MKNLTTLLLLLSLFAASCTSKGLFSKKTQHEQYEDKLEKTGVDDTPAGRQWKAASIAALNNSVNIQLPFAQKGLFLNDKPRALGLELEAKKGERISFSLAKSLADNFVIYADLFKVNGSEFDLVLSGDTNQPLFNFDVEETGSYVIRLQPEISRTGSYDFTIAKGPSLAFPVGDNKGKTGSFWGDSRDGGKRSHEGIDIFAPKKTPVVAAADGVVTGVKDGGIGGKTVWMRVAGKNITLYYAHLDKQLVQEGQEVKSGELLGLVGNTGNAKNTASHLHFGVYTFSGPVDPFPYVNQLSQKATAPSKNLPPSLKVVKTIKNKNEVVVNANTILVPLAVTQKGYIAELPDGKTILVDFNAVQPSKPVAANLLASDSKSTKQNNGMN